MDFTEKIQRQKMGFREYIEALEVERRKIEVFQRELPFCLELVTHAIEACRQQLSGTTTEYNLNGQSECSEQTSTEGPVLEEFIPIKKRDSPDCDEDDVDEQHSHKSQIIKKENTDKKKSDWLRSVQLWNPDPPAKEDVPRKASVVEVKRNGGAFQPFHREESSGKTNAPAVKTVPTSSPPVPATSSTAGASTGDNGGSNRRDEKESQAQRKQRRCWSPELHKRFLHALQQLGGPDAATPKQIRELMKVDGLTNDEVKSHLQKFRLHTRRPTTSIMHNNGSPHTAPFVLVGNIFVQPPDYAGVATSAASGEVTTVAPSGIYAPVAAHHPLVQKRPQLKKSEHSEQCYSNERTNHSEGAVHSNSPASSSSTHTTTASRGY